jgi:large subunit ribosomal protein L16
MGTSLNFSLQKRQKLRITGTEKKKQLIFLNYGSFGLKVCESGRISSSLLETIRRVFSRSLKKNVGQLWFRQGLNWPLTRKPVEIRMGKGKGAQSNTVIRIRQGSVFLEVESLQYDLMIQLLKVVAKKINLKSSLVFGRHYR